MSLIFLLVPIIFVMGWQPGAIAAIQATAPERSRALASAIMLFVINTFGLGLGPLAVGALSDLLAPQFGPDSIRIAMGIIPIALLWSAIQFLHAAKLMRKPSPRLTGFDRNQKIKL
jgi:hypothetical protein